MKILIKWLIFILAFIFLLSQIKGYFFSNNEIEPKIQPGPFFYSATVD